MIKDGQSQYVVTFESSQEVPIEAGAEYYVDVISQAGDSVSAPVGRQLLTGIIGISESQTCSTLSENSLLVVSTTIFWCE